MMKLIGTKRAIFAAILLGVNAAMALAYFMFVQPMHDGAVTQLTTLTSQISDLQTSIAKLKQELADLKTNMPKYQVLQDKGFFADQDRFKMGRNIEDLTNKAQLSSAPFTIGDIKEISNAGATAIKYRLIDSRVKMDKISTALDQDIYDFVQSMPDAFPGHTRVQSIMIRRDADVDSKHLSELAEGKPIGFVSADVAFDWLTMVPKEGTPPAGGAHP